MNINKLENADYKAYVMLVTKYGKLIAFVYSLVALYIVITFIFGAGGGDNPASMTPEVLNYKELLEKYGQEIPMINDGEELLNSIKFSTREVPSQIWKYCQERNPLFGAYIKDRIYMVPYLTEIEKLESLKFLGTMMTVEQTYSYIETHNADTLYQYYLATQDPLNRLYTKTLNDAAKEQLLLQETITTSSPIKPYIIIIPATAVFLNVIVYM